MKYSYTVSGQQLNKVFRGCTPCNCYDDPDKIYKVPRYDVNIRYGTTEYGYHGRIIEEITVECDCCGARERFNVERDEVYGNDLPW